MLYFFFSCLKEARLVRFLFNQLSSDWLHLINGSMFLLLNMYDVMSWSGDIPNTVVLRCLSQEAPPTHLPSIIFHVRQPANQ